jgi:hypothetical protein
MGNRFKPARCKHRQTRTVRMPDGELIERCAACGVTILDSEDMEYILQRAIDGKAGRLNVSDRECLNDDQVHPPDVEGQNLMFGGTIPNQLRIFSILLLLMLTPAIAAAAPPASWPDEWTAYLYGGGGYDTTYIDAVWSDAGGGYRSGIEAGVVLHGDAIAGGLMHAHVDMHGTADFDLGDWRQLDQAFCLNREGAGGQLDMMQFAGDTSGTYMPSCIGSVNVPEPAAAAKIAAVAGGILAFKRWRTRP